MADSSCCGSGMQKKVDGYDKWDITQAAESLTAADDVKTNPKLYKLAIAHLSITADKAAKAMAGKEVESKVKQKMKSTFK